jgi:N-acetylglucosaminyl-diphospho-decaprenol L-rhamnosyltransferase
LSERDLVVVVVNWNVRDLLIGCLESVFRALDVAGLCGEVCVVDNASSDDSVRAVRERFANKLGRGLCLISSSDNLWFGGGQNLALWAMGFSSVSVPQAGLAVARQLDAPRQTRSSLPRYVLVLNPDTLVREDALGEMVRFMDRAPNAGVCGPRLVYGDGRFQHSAYRFPTLAQTVLDFWPLHWRLLESRLNGRYARRLYQAGEPFAIDHPLGAAMLLRRQVVEQTGGFDLGYRMYVEEIDWCMRIKRAGWGVYCVPGAEIVHYEGQSTRQARPDMIVALWRSRYLLFAKYYSLPYRWFVRRLICAGMRANIRRTWDAFVQGRIDETTARSLIDAYREVIQLR